jgi:peptidoglycan/LPS O-acetylase OafA/YrhL
MMEKGRFLGLDGLRGVCAVTVMLGHCEMLFRPGVIFCHGYLAVDMFFMLSGFVISFSYDGRLEAGLGAGRFLTARVRRLAPVYWGGLFLCALAALASQAMGPASLGWFTLMGALLIPVLGPARFAYPINSVAWTLLWELIVNAAYAAGLRRLRGRWLAAVSLPLLLGALAFAAANTRHWSFGMTGLDLWMGGLRALPEFLIGVLLQRAWRAGYFHRLPAITPLWPLAAWLAIAAMPQNLSILFDLGVAMLVCPLLIALLVRSDDIAPVWFAPLGAISYPLYASHLAWIDLARHTPLFGLNRHPNILLALGMVLISLLVSWLLYRVLDPAGRTADRRSARFLSAQVAAAVQSKSP